MFRTDAPGRQPSVSVVDVSVRAQIRQLSVSSYLFSLMVKHHVVGTKLQNVFERKRIKCLKDDFLHGKRP